MLVKFFSFFFLIGLVASVRADSSADLAREWNTINPASVKDLWQKDLLEDKVQEKVSAIQKYEHEQKTAEKNQYQFPDEATFWDIYSEYWIVKNIRSLNWDHPVTDYGLKNHVKDFFISLGLGLVEPKILFIQNATIPHASLPSSKTKPLFLLSEPFIRSLNLNKSEMALLILEDYFRLETGSLIKFVQNKKLNHLFSQNFYPQKIEEDLWQQVGKKYQEYLFHRGMSLQDQFTVTKRMKKILSMNRPELMKTYVDLLKRIDQLTHFNLRYASYARLYPAPDIQVKWLGSNSW